MLYYTIIQFIQVQISYLIFKVIVVGDLKLGHSKWFSGFWPTVSQIITTASFHRYWHCACAVMLFAILQYCIQRVYFYIISLIVSHCQILS